MTCVEADDVTVVVVTYNSAHCLPGLSGALAAALRQVTQIFTHATKVDSPWGTRASSRGFCCTRGGRLGAGVRSALDPISTATNRTHC